ncbi:hypothetical protein [Paraflavitalea speifideaquila]|uniref:hypothetical protein n=1 Tax=Paraflavitalea speifideaquila TaxID=3076558 RepID=UPI0028E45BB9|nr:hypothetical protein [Paraflavitalea speifideiaquila]
MFRGGTITFSSANHEPFEITVSERNEYEVVLKQKVISMSDVVVVGYGRQKKANLVGAVSTVMVDEKRWAGQYPTFQQG